MYLKKIKIQGFKSFAEAIELVFPEGANITAVVGPNGCGKSNLLEAVRWGLGEQSYKTLRSGTSEQIIFSGSQNRKSVSLAEVTITLDNQKRILPIDYQEVEIRRRLYRSGENEYYLNRNLCRARDIHDLFLDTGVGRNSYAIIGQGQIDSLINAKPADKKKMLEEAAGINKYKQHKHNSLRKLEHTEQNLTRIEDLHSEVTSNLANLEMQSKKASQYLELKNQLRALELSSFQEKAKELIIGKTQAKEELSKQKKRLFEIRQLNHDHEQQQLEAEQTILKLELEEQLIKDKVAGLLDKQQQLEQNRLVQIERLANREQQIAQAKTELYNFQEETNKISLELSETKKDLQEKERWQEELTKLIVMEDKQLTNNRMAISKLQAEIKKIREEYSENKARLDFLEETRRNYDGYFQGVKAVMSEGKSTEMFSGILGIIADLIKAEKKYTLALETALGNHLQDIVTDNEKTAQSAIAFLRSGGLGRATFLPLTTFGQEDSESTKISLPQGAGLIGLAPDLLQTELRFKKIIKNLLGNVLIVEDLDSGLNLRSRLRNSGIGRLVSLTGDIVFISGMMVGGSQKRNNLPLLGRQNIIIELQALVKQLSEKMPLLEQEFSLAQANDDTNNQKLLEHRLHEAQNNEYLKQARLKAEILEEALAKQQETLARRTSLEKALEDEISQIKENLLVNLEFSLADLAEKLAMLEQENKTTLANLQQSKDKLSLVSHGNKGLISEELKILEQIQSTELQLATQKMQENNIKDHLASYNLALEDLLTLSTEKLPAETQEKTIQNLRRQLSSLEPVNLLAIDEFQSLQERESFIIKQIGDLAGAKSNLKDLIKELDELAEKDFLATLNLVDKNFQEVFAKLFDGGQANLKLLEGEDVLEAGVEVFVTLPRKRAQAMSLLSGGEKALTAVALIFALLKTKPTPFCFLDEVDAALDESNIMKFSLMLGDFALDSQIVIISHNKQTLTVADAIYGITMQEAGVSNLISLKLKSA